ncbi:MAG: peptidase M61, partial [Polyangiales bacterium]
SEDYYVEGAFIWLDVDTLIRERSKGQRSLDDFARAFFGVNDGDWGQLTYTFEDVVNTLAQVEPYDWAGFLRKRLDEPASATFLDGFKRGGYKLVFDENPNLIVKDQEEQRKQIDLRFSLGLVAEAKGKLTEVYWDSPAFKAGLTSGVEIVAVNGSALDGDRFKDVVKAAKSNAAPIALLIKQGDTYRTVNIDYHGGLRYPHLERIPNVPALLDDILAPKSAPKSKSAKPGP